MAGAKNGFKVVGAVAVLKLVAGGERYLYEGTVLATAGFDEASIKHHVAVGLIELVDVSEAPKPETAKGPYDGLSAAEVKAEIEKRNEGREDDAKVPSEGNKAELIAALVADDAKQAA